MRFHDPSRFSKRDTDPRPVALLGIRAVYDPEDLFAIVTVCVVVVMFHVESLLLGPLGPPLLLKWERLARSANGRVEWKDLAGRSLKESD